MPTRTTPRPPGYKKPKTYIVRKGQTLEQIAEQFGVTETQLVSSNRSIGPITAGLVMNIPNPPGLNENNTGGFWNDINTRIFGPGGIQGWFADKYLHLETQPITNTGWSAIANAPVAATQQQQGSSASGFNALVNPSVSTTNVYNMAQLRQIGEPSVSEQRSTLGTGGNYSENLPYGKSYNYSVTTGEIPNPGSSAAVNYGDESVYQLARSMVDGYGYDYGNYLKWAAQHDIQQPASYYQWRSTQGITYSGQSSQFWDYMQSIQSGKQKGYGKHTRQTIKEMQDYRAAKSKNPNLTYRKWKMAIGGKGRFIQQQQPDTSNNAATQPYYPYYSYNSGGNQYYYNRPTSFGLVTLRMF